MSSSSSSGFSPSASGIASTNVPGTPPVSLLLPLVLRQLMYLVHLVEAFRLVRVSLGQRKMVVIMYMSVFDLENGQDQVRTTNSGHYSMCSVLKLPGLLHVSFNPPSIPEIDTYQPYQAHPPNPPHTAHPPSGPPWGPES